VFFIRSPQRRRRRRRRCRCRRCRRRSALFIFIRFIVHSVFIIMYFALLPVSVTLLYTHIDIYIYTYVHLCLSSCALSPNTYVGLFPVRSRSRFAGVP